MTNEEARAYFIDSNERVISVAKDENNYNYETQQIEDVFIRRYFEANSLAIKALDQISHLKDRPCEACEFHTEEGCSKWECVFEGSNAE